MSGLLRTKLRRPVLPPKRVLRPQLVQRLNEGLESGQQITLVSAPAGFGKTICVSEWLDTLQDWPVAWLSLDPADDEPGRFFSYLIAALQMVDRRLGHEIEGLLRAGQVPPGEILSTTLVNDILDMEKPFLLVLDDFQVIQEAFILQFWEELVSNFPRPLHLVLLSREDPALPLARLRANNQLSEIRVGNLRFSSLEAGRFLKEVMDLSLSEANIARLEERTEGWIVGLQLVGLSMRGRSDPGSFISELSGSHRYILSYLSEEVLNQQSDETRLFLLQTAILDKLSGELCDAVTGRADSAELLERLLAANLFLIPLDDEQHWYRYHQLFSDLLRDLQLSLLEDQSAELHRRASRWYAQADMVSEAIQHALQAGDYAMAVGLFERHALDMLVQWHVKTVDGWMQAIPEYWVAGSLSANLTFAWMYLQRGAFDQAAPYLQRLQKMFTSSQTVEEAQDSEPVPPSLQAKWLALQSMLLNAQGKVAESLGLSRQALVICPQDDLSTLSMIYMGLADAYQQVDDYTQALEAYQKIIQLGRRVENIVYEMLGVAGLVLMAIEHGQLHYGFEIASQGLERMQHSGVLPPVSTAIYGELGEVYYQWHRIEEANQNFLRSSQVSKLSGYSDAEIYHQVVRSRLAQMDGDLNAAAEEIRRAVDLMQIEAPSRVRNEVIAQQVRVELARHQLAAAESVLMREGFPSRNGKFSLPALEPGEKLNRPTGLLYGSALRILLYRARVRGEQAGLKAGIELANQMLSTLLERQQIQFGLELLLLRSQLHAAVGDKQSSQTDLVQALELGEPEGFISVFLDEGSLLIEALVNLLEENMLDEIQAAYVHSILAHSPKYGTVKGDSEKRPAGTGALLLVEPLTERELEVLYLMAEGLKYKEIAARLFISLNTVRTHVKAIYSKLGVDNRTKAIEAAHQLQIL